MKFFALFPAKFSDLIDRTLKITQNTRRRGRSLRQCAQFRGFCSADGKTCAHSGQMCGPGGRFFRPAARRAGFLQEAEEKAAEKGSPPRGAGAKRLRGCTKERYPPRTSFPLQKSYQARKSPKKRERVCAESSVLSIAFFCPVSYNHAIDSNGAVGHLLTRSVVLFKQAFA